MVLDIPVRRLALLSFRALGERLLERVRRDVREGARTERGLARSTLMSQPHVHNVLAGHRGLTTETADALLCELRLSTYDLFELEEVLELEARRSGLLGRQCRACIERRGLDRCA